MHSCVLLPAHQRAPNPANKPDKNEVKTKTTMAAGTPRRLTLGDADPFPGWVWRPAGGNTTLCRNRCCIFATACFRGSALSKKASRFALAPTPPFFAASPLTDRRLVRWRKKRQQVQQPKLPAGCWTYIGFSNRRARLQSCCRSLSRPKTLARSSNYQGQEGCWTR